MRSARKIQNSFSPTRVTSPEKASAFLTTGVLLTGAVVALMLAIWLFSEFKGKNASAIPILPLQGSTTEDDSGGVSNEDEEPGVEDFPELEKPEYPQAIAAITDLPSTVLGRLEKYDGTSFRSGPGDLGIRGTGTKKGVPNFTSFDRWNIKYSTADLKTYARQISALGVEIGVVSLESDRIDLISNLSTSPVARRESRSNEKRVFFSHASTQMRNLDRALISQAGVLNLKDRIIGQFYSNNVVAYLAKLESEYARRKGFELNKVTLTTFNVRESRKGYEFYVESME